MVMISILLMSPFQ